ncbi:UNVERIFIED_CONTAM: hypothetical protein K2H54_031231 [Gekko kuhli]
MSATPAPNVLQPSLAMEGGVGAPPRTLEALHGTAKPHRALGRHGRTPGAGYRRDRPRTPCAARRNHLEPRCAHMPCPVQKTRLFQEGMTLQSLG